MYKRCDSSIVSRAPNTERKQTCNDDDYDNDFEMMLITMV